MSISGVATMGFQYGSTVTSQGADFTVGVSFMTLTHLHSPISIAEMKSGFICKEVLSPMVLCPLTMHSSSLNRLLLIPLCHDGSNIGSFW